MLRRHWRGVHGLVMWNKWEMKNRQREQMPRKWRRNGGEEDRNCDGEKMT